MIWEILRICITFVLPIYYRKIQGHNLDLLKRKGPMILAMNHPNAFTDPVALILLTYPLRLRYIARGDAFRPGLISRLLRAIGIIPVFRLRDAGKEGLKRNEES